MFQGDPKSEKPRLQSFGSKFNPCGLGPGSYQHRASVFSLGKHLTVTGGPRLPRKDL